MTGAVPRTYKGWRNPTPTNESTPLDVVINGIRVQSFGGDPSSLTAGGDTTGLVSGVGNATTQLGSSSASVKFISNYFTGSGATSVEGTYLRTYATGAGTTLNSLRAFGTVSNVAAGNARGAHISLSFGTSGTVTGLAAAIEATLHMPSGGAMAGTDYAIKAAINADASTSDPAGATTIGFLGIVAQGDQSGIDDLEDDGVMLDFQGFTADNDASHIVSSVSLAELPAGTIGVRAKVGSTLYYIPLVAASAWN